MSPTTDMSNASSEGHHLSAIASSLTGTGHEVDVKVMDATVDQDLMLQKSSPERIAELRNCLPRFLWKCNNCGRSSALDSKSYVRRLVRQRKTDQLLKLLEPFQEWPQLLDPHLSGLLEPLVSAFIAYLSYYASDYYPSTRNCSSADIIPLPRAICQILYVFCKIRGQKVIVRFLNNEPRYLEPMIDALEAWANPTPPKETSTLPDQVMIWQERFIILLWLSHLVLAPFDLASMSSGRAGRSLGATCLDIEFPFGTPSITKRLVHVSAYFLGFASKERDAAGILLARLALKPDVLCSGLYRRIVESLCVSLEGRHDIDLVSTNIHATIGQLSFLVRLVTSAESHTLASLLERVYYILFEKFRSVKNPLHREMASSTIARKLVIKLGRAIAAADVKINSKHPLIGSPLGDGAIEEIMEHLLIALDDTDTSVRIAASKALSLVVLEVETDDVQAVFSHLNAQLADQVGLWEDSQSCQVDYRYVLPTASVERAWAIPKSFKPDFSAANAKKWHGIVLTLSQLILRRAIPAEQIGIVLEGLLVALQFEQRSPLGVSVGTIVRDAACFGLWSLARRYTTAQLSRTTLAEQEFEGEATLQRLANDLVVAATLDPAGNIRRGASAALQEMVGRHPNVIKYGIRLVQVVDYHAVALRSAAMREVAMEASDLHQVYWNALLDGLMGWRGVCSSDAEIRRQAAYALGRLTLDSSQYPFYAAALISVRQSFARTPFRKFEEQHGLLLALSQIVLSTHEILVEKREEYDLPTDAIVGLWLDFYKGDNLPWIVTMGRASHDTVHLSPVAWNLVLEGRCRFISAMALVYSDSRTPGWLKTAIVPPSGGVQVALEVVNRSLRQRDPEVLRVATEAANNIFPLLSHGSCNGVGRDDVVSDWVGDIKSANPSSPMGDLVGVIAALGAVFHHIYKPDVKSTEKSRDKVLRWLDVSRSQVKLETSDHQDLVIETLVRQITRERSIEIKCSALSSLTTGVLKYKVCTDDILGGIIKCLEDYTINEKGDVGSLVRVEAIGAASVILDEDLEKENKKRQLLVKVGGLTVEKLDKVRWRAWNCLKPHMSAFAIDQDQLAVITDAAQTSSTPYFSNLLPLSSIDWTQRAFLEGYITSAGAGSESLVQASRSALAAYADTIFPEESHGICMMIVNIFMDNISNDRLSVPAMELLVFLFNANIIQLLPQDEAIWQHFFKQLQQAHYKSPNIPKIEAAVKLYAALTAFAPMRKLVLKKLCHMLSHPFSKVRNAAAESLYIVTEDEEMLAVNWSQSPKETAQKLQLRLEV